MIKIGISACLMYPDPNRLVFGPKTLNYLEQDMATFVCQEGVLPVLIPSVDDRYLYPILEQMDGFLFQGGTDLSPSSYGEQPIIPGKWLGDPVRDSYELKLMEFAFKKDKPLLAICRGFQLLNVFLGGTLYQDIATQRLDAILHRDAEAYDNLKHEVTLVPDRLLAQLYGKVGDCQVNSVHHQGIKDLGKDLEVLANSREDGIIEAVGYTQAAPGKVLGVQWHPEFSYGKKDGTLDSSKIIELFLSHVKEEIHASH
ncbi:MAG: gamma-glutamyl-gamma-aminobutyrate hydrolase family protein [Lunatimonas sp.]|uniref:gamma-glutamyl-gamma-aminobutyrate hydrolase family protein n=1 Tax=Lunatimonas sp. TaxID=2060141 RepID=UPI00263BA1F1|nr:gamma-glutamyl-gamma-aminobutyrate hydrolase family protein [Lunatimonas sp.]MCC5939553.1 gamma-glutamyl-gamma-aminobutyrate hydrolase family protein [Lunatimonas sp.]